MRLSQSLSALMFLGSITMAGQAVGSSLVVPSGRANSASSANTNGIFASVNTLPTVGFQLDIAASQLSTVAVGTPVVGIGFRLYSSYGTITQELDYSDFTIDIGTAASTIANLSGNFGANEGPGTIVARTGPLTIAANTFIGNKRINPFYEINFSTPYTYTGGDLLITLLDTESGSLPVVPLDAIGTNANLGDVGSTNAQGTQGKANYFYAPVSELYFGAVAVPEPSSLGMLAGAFCVAAAVVLTGRRVRFDWR